MMSENSLPPVHPGEAIPGRPSRGDHPGRHTARYGAFGRRRGEGARRFPADARLFGSTPEFRMRLQAVCDLKKASRNKRVMEIAA